MTKNKSLKIDMCAGSELKDTQGETLSVEGADIDDLIMGKGRLNDNHGKGNFNCLGHITEAKKIFKAEDCENDRHKYYWEKIKAPYIYVAGELFNNEDHPNARAAAAIIKNVHKKDIPLKMKASVEGGVVSRGIKDPTRLARTKIHSVALTFTPANNATLVEPLNIDKSYTDWEADKQLIKSVMHLAETNVPSFRHIERHASANTIHDNIFKIQELAKSLGIEIEVKGTSPEVIMKNAVHHKLFSNIKKINELVKAVSATAQDRYQQGIGKLQSAASAPIIPKEDNPTHINTKMKTQGTASQIKSRNTIKRHAMKAANDPDHLDSVHSQLIDRGVHPDKASAIINKIHSHNLSKGEFLDNTKKLAAAGALIATTAGIGTPDKTKASKEKPREEKVAEYNKKIRDPDLLIDPKSQGYDARKPNAKKEWLNRRKEAKDKLKKALTAGYGGAGAPTNLSGGGVFQQESLEDGKTKKSETSDGITYISCNECGHEQVYMQHQVKCRDCNKNFPLNKLEDHM